MQYCGCIDNKIKALTEAEKLAQTKNKTVVIEKAKRKDGVHKYTTYRAWLICSSDTAKVIDIAEWRNLPEEQKH